MKALLSKSYCVPLGFFSCAGRWCSVFPSYYYSEKKNNFFLCLLFELRRTFLRPKSSLLMPNARARPLEKALYQKWAFLFNCIHDNRHSVLSNVSRKTMKTHSIDKQDVLRFSSIYVSGSGLLCFALESRLEHDKMANLHDHLDF